MRFVGQQFTPGTARRPDESRRTHHGCVGVLAGLSCVAPLVGGCSKLSASRLQPSEHVGKQSAGAGGWVAAAGSAGITGCSDGLGAEAQPDTSHSSSATVSSSATGRRHSLSVHLGNRSSSLSGQQPGGLCRSGVRLRPLDADGLCACRVGTVAAPGQRADRADDDCAVQVRTYHASLTLAGADP